MYTKVMQISARVVIYAAEINYVKDTCAGDLNTLYSEYSPPIITARRLATSISLFSELVLQLPVSVAI